MNKPLFTIITVTLNSEKHLENTIQSVISQTFHDYEYIIIDGGSKDATIEIIKKYNDKINNWISERDKGIYDAMNKGIERSRGEWLFFLNSDDVFSDENVLSNFSDIVINNPQYGLIYGKTAIYDKTRLKFIRGTPVSPKDYWYPSKFICHQSVFFHKNAFNRVGKYDINPNGGISDNLWFINYFYFHNEKALFVDKMVSHFSTGGYSDSHIMEGYWGRLKFARHHFPFHIVFKIYCEFPAVFLKIKILQLHKETLLKKFLQYIKRVFIKK